MKSALRARLTRPNWTRELPRILLGIRTAPKKDLATSSAQLAYGSPITVPGNFIASPTPADEPAQDILPALREKVASFLPVPTSQHGTSSSSVPRTLRLWQYVFIRRDIHKSPLERPYEGPFKVIRAATKTFTLDRGGNLETVSVDRLKPAHLDLDMPVAVHIPKPRGRPRK